MNKASQPDTVFLELPHTLHQKVDRLAKKTKRPLTDFLHDAVEEYVEAMEKASDFRRSHFEKGLKSPQVPQEEVDILFTKLRTKYGGGAVE